VSESGLLALARAARQRALAVLLTAGATVSRWRRARRPYPVLRVELSGDLRETPRGLGLRDLGRPSSVPDLLTLLSSLRSAREDDELRMVVLDIHGLGAGWGSLQSLRPSLIF